MILTEVPKTFEKHCNLVHTESNMTQRIMVKSSAPQGQTDHKLGNGGCFSSHYLSYIVSGGIKPLKIVAEEASLLLQYAYGNVMTFHQCR